ncbi:amino acid permease/ SLC12A domain-containing protein [Aspergillus caelatus]|uniref:Amino acid permease/ SLC12A domain-containing protein n=2 Tax=Aspergillus subgen. Circumdati TaxID=2720871 RepID=A0A5N7AJ02_9EURO|nr:amino acid permease/ SLC12A domain-containing protein [Aspergillus caelatus]KAE8368989.1 amino acid permease/ SLC12A domain-containing protein [Aspergillus caelatus]KAE8413256.1 amino acid permease/ SLC12A domain-containing protein [Aspergillus pseudocaelatus]
MGLNEEKTTQLEPSTSGEGGSIHVGESMGTLHRRLGNRQIQLIAAGGSIGTALFISIGGGLAKGGPGSLFIAYTLYSCILGLVNNSIAEMNTYMPVSGGFIRLAGYWVDDALGFLAGWNFFFYEAFLIPFEITALSMVMSFWNPSVTEPGPTAGICAAVIICYASLNILAVKFYGEAEFWLSGGKLVLIFILFAFTFVTMVGGNPQHDAYGFRHFNNPGPFAEFHTKGDLGRFEGFLAALWSASFCVVGPEYISMVSAEAQRPSVYIKSAFKTVYYRFCIFFVIGSLAVGIVVAYNDPALVNIYFGDGDSSTAAASPYVIAMENLGISVLPHIVNALIFTSIFSAGNTYTYCATRSLYSLAVEGRAPRILRYCNKSGVPIYCFCVVMLFPFLSFLQVGSGSAQAITWFVNLVTGGGLINYFIMSVTFINYYRACKAQGVDRKKMPYCGWFQPYGAYIAVTVHTLVIIFYGYSSFTPWSVSNFFSNYTMQLVAPCLFIFWKVVKKTRYVRPHEVDLVWERPEIDAYENSITTPPVGFWSEMIGLVGIGRKKNRVDPERDN